MMLWKMMWQIVSRRLIGTVSAQISTCMAALLPRLYCRPVNARSFETLIRTNRSFDRVL